MRLNLPRPRATSCISFPTLGGGLNLWELDSRLDADQSPEMENLCRYGGTLRSRDGQSYAYTAAPGTGVTAYRSMFGGCAFMHIGTGIWYCDPEADPCQPVQLCDMSQLFPGKGSERGSFFTHGEHLYYKAPGVYVRISISGGSPTAEKTPAYTPVIMLNCSPQTGAGDLYQPENRYSPYKTVKYNTDGGSLYRLPVSELDCIERVEVNGQELEADTDYTYNLTEGSVSLAQAPQAGLLNAVAITYKKDNPDFADSILSCRCAEVYGGAGELCVVLGGCEKQPNAYFWSGNGRGGAPDAGYFPAEQYNLAGDSAESITGFGLQQDLLVIFKQHSVGRARFSMTQVDGREYIELPYVTVNPTVGCDLPWTIRLIENNLVFCNSRRGVHMILDSSAACENNIVMISRAVNGTGQAEMTRGLLYDLANPNGTCPVAFDDDSRYWICVGGHAYLWDYTLSKYTRPSWFYYTGIGAVAFFRDGLKSYHLDGQGRVTRFDRSYADYGQGIRKRYRFAVQSFDGFDRFKDVLYGVFDLYGDIPSVTRVYYSCGAMGTMRAADIVCGSKWRLVPRDLSQRDLRIEPARQRVKRMFGVTEAEDFSMWLENDTPGEDLCIGGAELYFRYSREKK